MKHIWADAILEQVRDNDESSSESKSEGQPHSEYNEESPSKAVKPKQVRWRREDDKEAFRILNKKLIELNITLPEFISWIDTNPNYLRLASNVALESHWQRNTDTFIQRLKFIVKGAQKFSTRNQRLFKKLTKDKYRLTSAEYYDLLYHFPGMTIDQLKEITVTKH